MAIFAKQALTPDGWADNVRIECSGGRITTVTIGGAPEAGDERHAIVVPGMANVHSHAFQRAMAGLTEKPSAGNDNFWSWREVMYRFTFAFDPDEVEAVASQLYVEMLEAGFTRVGEFHYLHHDKDGHPYGNIAEMAERIAAASSQTGIGLTLLPVFYAHSNFGGLPPGDGQRRFINDLNRFETLLAASIQAVQGLSQAVVGIAPHSLRAATGEEINALEKMDFSGPIHIHAAEQIKEIADSLAFSGQRPVEWLINNTDAGPRWCFIHATHMDEDEARAMATRGVTAGLCPITEGNLGDGFFRADTFFGAKGGFGIGSDSNVLISMAAELRQLEYSQRLLHRARNVLSADGHSTGRTLFDGAIAGGARAMAVETGIATGRPADFISLRPDFDFGLGGDTLLDNFIFASDVKVDCVWVGGDKKVEGGRHKSRAAVTSRYQAAMRAMLSKF